MSFNQEKIDIILSWRIGDAILALPMLVCLKQLNEKYSNNAKIRILVQPFLKDLFSGIEVLGCAGLSIAEKLKSHILPSDKAIFLETTSKSFGYHSKESYGLTNPCKKHLKFSKQLPFLDFEKSGQFLPEELVIFLSEKYGLADYPSRLFGVCLELGYTVDQIIDTFELNYDVISLKKFTSRNFIKDDYLVFCMEVAYGRKGTEFRRWGEESFLEIAERCCSEFGVKAVFVGTNTNFELPDKPYFIDMRKKVSLFRLAQLMRFSRGYVGNDTGPLHIANIMQKKSIGLYFDQGSVEGFSPVFSELNARVFNPANIDEVYNVIKNHLEEMSPKDP